MLQGCTRANTHHCDPRRPKATDMLLPYIQACEAVVIEPLLIAHTVCKQVVVLEGGHAISGKALILTLEEKYWITSCAIELQQ